MFTEYVFLESVGTNARLTESQAAIGREQLANSKVVDASFQRLTNACVLGETSIMLPVHPTLGTEQMERIADAMISILSKASR